MKAKNKNFKFSEEDIGRIKRLNFKLKKEEERVRFFSNKLISSLKSQEHAEHIDDFNFSAHIAFFSSNPACNKRHNVEEGDPIAEERHVNLFNERIDDSFYDDNWNELVGLSPEHPLAKIPFCYSMHCLAFHCDTTWQDIVDIDDVWITLKVDYQFFVGNKRRNMK
jgi:hypothetical protein